MELKYSKEISEIEKAKDLTCIGVTYKEEDRKAYRWTFENIEDVRNFLPRALLTEGVMKDSTMKACKGWGLSFFTGEDLALNELNRLCSDKKFLYKKLGTHIAEGNINKTDGANGDYHPTSGHFTHFEYKETDFHKKFIVKVEVYKEE